MNLELNIVDYCFLGVLAASLIYGLIRGLTREILSLVAWVLAFLAAKVLSLPLSKFLVSWVDSSTVRGVAAFIGLLVVFIFLFSFLAIKISKMVKATSLTGIDRLLGSVFGFFRGILILSLVVMFLELSAITRYDWWISSSLRPYFEDFGEVVQPRIPELEWGVTD